MPNNETTVKSSNDREMKMAARKLTGTKKYLEFLRSNGGWVDCEQYGQLIGLSKEQIEDRVAALELVPVTINGEIYIPLYQYDECRQEELYGLSSINKRLLGAQQLGNSGVSTWWLSGETPRRTRLISEEDVAVVYDRLMAQARLAGEMGR